jgi:hypothetical protein
MELKGLIVLVAYAIGINLLLVSFANLNVGVSCPNLSKFVNATATVNQSEITYNSASIIDIALNRCSGLPSWIFWVMEVPVILGLLYIVRAFIGAT